MVKRLLKQAFSTALVILIIYAGIRAVIRYLDAHVKSADTTESETLGFDKTTVPFPDTVYDSNWYGEGSCLEDLKEWFRDAKNKIIFYF